jgi:hypothetical protein
MEVPVRMWAGGDIDTGLEEFIGFGSAYTEKNSSTKGG